MPFRFPTECGQTICWTWCTYSTGCTKVDPHYQISCHFLLKGIKTTWSSPLLLGQHSFLQANSQPRSGIEQAEEGSIQLIHALQSVNGDTRPAWIQP